MDHSISIFEAWALWWEGEIPRDAVLWGHHLFFWGRLGRMLEFGGAFAVVVDIFGSQQILGIANWLRDWSKDPGRKILEVMFKRRTVIVGLSLCLLVSIVVVGFIANEEIKPFPVLPFTEIYPPRFVSVVWIVCAYALFLYFFSFPIYFIMFGLITALPARWIGEFLQRPNADKWLKLLGLPLITLGFHFDLLAS